MTSSDLRGLAAACVALMLLAGSAAAQQPQPPAPILTGTGPNGATIRCRDGSYPAPTSADSACDGKGGVLVRFPMRATPQQAVAPSRPVQTAMRASAMADTAAQRPAGFVPWRERRAAAAAEAARQRPPAGATLRCGDGSWVVGDTTSARCASHGGVTLRIARPRGRGGD